MLRTKADAASIAAANQSPSLSSFVLISMLRPRVANASTKKGMCIGSQYQMLLHAAKAAHKPKTSQFMDNRLISTKSPPQSTKPGTPRADQKSNQTLCGAKAPAVQGLPSQPLTAGAKSDRSFHAPHPKPSKELSHGLSVTTPTKVDHVRIRLYALDSQGMSESVSSITTADAISSVHCRRPSNIAVPAAVVAISPAEIDPVHTAIKATAKPIGLGLMIADNNPSPTSQFGVKFRGHGDSCIQIAMKVASVHAQGTHRGGGTKHKAASANHCAPPSPNSGLPNQLRRGKAENGSKTIDTAAIVHSIIPGKPIDFGPPISSAQTPKPSNQVCWASVCFQTPQSIRANAPVLIAAAHSIDDSATGADGKSRKGRHLAPPGLVGPRRVAGSAHCIRDDRDVNIMHQQVPDRRETRNQSHTNQADNSSLNSAKPGENVRQHGIDFSCLGCETHFKFSQTFFH